MMTISPDQIIGQKLTTALAMIPLNTYIALGSKSAYFFIGTVWDFLMDNESIYKRYVERATRLMNETKSEECRKTHENYLANVKPFFEREVVKVKQRHIHDEPKIITMILDGNEIGEYWLLTEYQTKIVEGVLIG